MAVDPPTTLLVSMNPSNDLFFPTNIENSELGQTHSYSKNNLFVGTEETLDISENKLIQGDHQLSDDDTSTVETYKSLSEPSTESYKDVINTFYIDHTMKIFHEALTVHQMNMNRSI